MKLIKGKQQGAILRLMDSFHENLGSALNTLFSISSFCAPRILLPNIATSQIFHSSTVFCRNVPSISGRIDLLLCIKTRKLKNDNLSGNSLIKYHTICFTALCLMNNVFNCTAITTCCIERVIHVRLYIRIAIAKSHVFT